MEMASLLCVHPSRSGSRRHDIHGRESVLQSIDGGGRGSLNPLKLSKEKNYWLAFAYNTLLAALAALSIMSTMISLFAITQCSGSTPETIYASLARAGAFVHFFAVLWWQTLVMLALVSVAAWLRSGWLGGAVATS